MTDRQIPRTPGERLTKLEGARRQVKTAVRMFLEERDDVSIYTLACAAQDVLRGLLKARGAEEASFIKDTIIIKPEYYRDYLSIINAPQNFFKHADRDPHETIEFLPQLVPFVLHDCVRMYAKLTGRMLREGSAFVSWFMLEYPHLLYPGPFADQAKNVSAETADIRGRRLYLMLLDRPEMWPDTD
jgi:hypothetical protein